MASLLSPILKNTERKFGAASLSCSIQEKPIGFCLLSTVLQSGRLNTHANCLPDLNLMTVTEMIRDDGHKAVCSAMLRGVQTLHYNLALLLSHSACTWWVSQCVNRSSSQSAGTQVSSPTALTNELIISHG